MKTFLFLALISVVLFSCSKSSSSNSNNGGGNTTGIFPLAVNNVWNYKLKDYNTATGAVIDSSYFTITVTTKTTANGNTYYELVNSLNNGAVWLTNLTSTTLGSIDSVGGVSYFTFFVDGTGDSLQSVSSWPVTEKNRLHRH